MPRDRSPSRVSTRSGVSTGSGVSGVTTVSTDTKKSKRSISLPWKKKRRTSTATTVSQMSGVSAASGISQGSAASRATTDISEDERGRGRVDEMGFVDLSASPDGTQTSNPPIPSPLPASISSRTTATTTSASSVSSHQSRPASLTSQRRASSATRSVSGNSSDAQSRITFVDSPAPSSTAFSVPRPPSVLSGISGFSGLSRSSKERDRDASKERDKEGEGPGWKEFAKGTYTYPILLAIPGHAPPTLDTASSHQRPWNPSNRIPNTSSNSTSSKDVIAWGGYAGGHAGAYGAYNGNGVEEDLPHCTLKWQLKASVHRPGAFASKVSAKLKILLCLHT
ncbi:hypothetical protein GYMLUDRAFT_876697 [Collybiopsis luxurians FD-317 M1]|nr:hypothetical protein GYMLUDRAFT_876697 [Collybiopsis luxurians FD-317 M1]